MTKKNVCFVLSPFKQPFNTYYGQIVQPAINDAGLRALKADEIYGARPIIKDIWQSIRSSQIILAEVTGRNPNVLYEIGLCHALDTPVVMITQTMDDVPFDLKAIRCIVYQTEDPNWSKTLRRDIKQTILATLSDKNAGLIFPRSRGRGSALLNQADLDELFSTTTFGALMLVAAIAEIGGGPISVGDVLIQIREQGGGGANHILNFVRECFKKELLICLDKNGKVLEVMRLTVDSTYYLLLTPLGKQLAVLWKRPERPKKRRSPGQRK